MTGIDFAKGFRAVAVEAKITKAGRKDLALIISDNPAAAAGVFTTNHFAAAPVQYCREILKKQKQFRGIVVNSGNANAGTGEQGYKDAVAMAEAAANALGCSADEIFVASTGVIGRQMPMEKILLAIAEAAKRIKNDSSGIDAAKAIMTTDTVEKIVEIEFDGVRIGGIAKGAGMIHPNMATMLSFITTDAEVSSEKLQEILKRVVNLSFNCISVDNDMSTNDTVIILANGAAGRTDLEKFEKNLTELCITLSKKIVADGEGATKFVTITINSARDEREAYLAADAIATSMLVKTALFGNDPNWGRILAAVGRSGAYVETNRVTIDMCGICIFENGNPLPVDLSAVSSIMRKGNIEISVNMNLGNGSKTVFTSDLTKEYVSINADYTT